MSALLLATGVVLIVAGILGSGGLVAVLAGAGLMWVAYLL